MTRGSARLSPCAAFGPFAIFVTLLAPGVVSARRPTCPPATYTLHQSIVDIPRARADTISLDRSQLSIAGLCPPTEVRLRGSKKGTKVTAKWDSCQGLPGRHVTLKGKIDISCGTFLGTIKTKKPKFKGVIIATKTVGESLRIATYNVQGIPSFFNAGTSEKKAKKIAERVIAAGYDFIVLNEAFDEDIRDIFRKNLAGAFPYYVSRLDGDTLSNEDSGLMLFSRLPLEMPLTTWFEPSADNCEGSDCSRVRFDEYDACQNPDCRAEKGAGYVRLRNPKTDTIYNVLFTHTQASYSDDDRDDAGDHVAARASQFHDMETMLINLLPYAALNNEHIFLLGDLNIDGDLDNPDVVDNGEVAWEVENIREWHNVFGSLSSFWHNTFVDGWAFDNAPKPPSGVYDRGLTNRGAWGAGSEGARLDYILHNKAGRLCIQHMTLAHNLRWSKPNGAWTESGMGPNGIGLAGTEKLSDHIGLNADINLESPHCRPVEASAPALTPGQPQLLDGNLLFAGSMQWFRFDEAGTYSFAVTSGNGTDFRVYQADDLSTPISQYKNLTVTIEFSTRPPVEAKVFHTSKAPFYVRVFNPDRTETGAYTLVAVEHDCSTKELACALGPAEAGGLIMAASPPLNSPDEAWFLATPEALPNGLTQHIKLDVNEVDPAGAAAFHLDVEDENGTPLDQVLVPEVDIDGRMHFHVERDESSGAPIYMVVRRQPSGGLSPPYPNAARSFAINWKTDLSILYGTEHGGDEVEIWCQETNDPPVPVNDGNDEIKLKWVKVDGTKVAGPKYIQDFDAGNNAALEPIIKPPIYFFGSVVFHFLETDGGLNGEDDVMEGTILPLAEGAPEPLTGQEIVMYPDGGGMYSLYYNLAHGFDSAP